MTKYRKADAIELAGILQQRLPGARIETINYGFDIGIAHGKRAVWLGQADKNGSHYLGPDDAEAVIAQLTKAAE